MNLVTHKFGGASVRDAKAIRRIGDLLSEQIQSSERVVVVVSAMGKTTNALEAIWSETRESERRILWRSIVKKHLNVADDLTLSSELKQTLTNRMELCYTAAEDARNKSMDAAYDSIVAAGELASTTLVEAWLSQAGMSVGWWDVRDTIHTSGPHLSLIHI